MYVYTEYWTYFRDTPTWRININYNRLIYIYDGYVGVFCVFCLYFVFLSQIEA